MGPAKLLAGPLPSVSLDNLPSGQSLPNGYPPPTHLGSPASPSRIGIAKDVTGFSLEGFASLCTKSSNASSENFDGDRESSCCASLC